MQLQVQRILDFWFGNGIKLNSRDYVPTKEQFKLWFQAGPDTDAHIAATFAPAIRSLAASFTAPPADPAAATAALLLFDQLPRNAFRGTPESFAYDPLALRIAKEMVAQGQDRLLNPIVRGFLYLPFEHAEDMDEQATAVRLYSGLLDAVNADPGLSAKYSDSCRLFLDYAQKHCELIRRFGRFPHRNSILGRESTDQERAYLENGGETFGVNGYSK